MDNARLERLIGGLHIHTTRSSDGEWPLEKCKEVFKKEGYQFLALTEHAEDMNLKKMEEWTAACDALSDPEFLLIPGLEFSMRGGMHILGFGLRKIVPSESIEQLLDEIQAAGGVAVWAHPPPEALNMIFPYVDRLNGMEIWNGRYHGTRRPSLRLLLALGRLRESHPAFHGFGGIDFHEGDQDREISVVVESERSAGAILEALRTGKFHIQKGKVLIPATGALSLGRQIGMALAATFS